MKRVLIKLSGEGLASKEKSLAIDPAVVTDLVNQIKQIKEKGVQVGIVIGGGNFWRGASAEANGIERNRADYIGMLATIMNGLALQSSFEQAGVEVRLYSALRMDEKVSQTYVKEKAVASLEKGAVVIFSGGTGRPYFTTDTATTLVATEIEADTILMGKNGVDGIYDSDPRVNKDAKRFETITWDQIIELGLKVMDSTAASLAKDNNTSLIVFDIKKENSLLKAIEGTNKHTKVKK